MWPNLIYVWISISFFEICIRMGKKFINEMNKGKRNEPILAPLTTQKNPNDTNLAFLFHKPEHRLLYIDVLF